MQGVPIDQQRHDKDLAVLEAMGQIFCRANHEDRQRDAAGLCPECRETIMATLKRTDHCPNGHSGNCSDCPIKCNRGQQQERIRAIMRYSAPRMVYRHPLMTAGFVRKKMRSKRSGTD